VSPAASPRNRQPPRAPGSVAAPDDRTRLFGTDRRGAAACAQNRSGEPLPVLSGGSSPGDAGEAAALVLATQEFVADGVGRP